MKRFIFLFILVFLVISINAQKRLIPNKQFMLGCTNVGQTENITHYISAEGVVWQYSSGSFVSGGVTSNSIVTTGNANFGSNDWPGFNFNWLRGSPYWSLGLYEVTNSKQTDKYFYLDSRDSDFGNVEYPPDFYIYFDNAASIYKHRFTNEEISQGEIVRVWDIHDESPNTSSLQNYWSKVLVILTDQNNPRIVWSPHPTFQATNYKVYRAYSTTPLNKPELSASVIATVSSSTYEYKDNDISLSTNGNYLYCFVKAYNGSYSGRTNIEEVRGYFYKENLNVKGERKKYELNQNYPNPFNPSTKIKYTVAEPTYISLKVYDVLGNEIKNLVSQEMDTGNLYY